MHCSRRIHWSKKHSTVSPSQIWSSSACHLIFGSCLFQCPVKKNIDIFQCTACLIKNPSRYIMLFIISGYSAIPTFFFSFWSIAGMEIDGSGFRCDQMLIGFIKLSQAAFYKQPCFKSQLCVCGSYKGRHVIQILAKSLDTVSWHILCNEL